MWMVAGQKSYVTVGGLTAMKSVRRGKLNQYK